MNREEDARSLLAACRKERAKLKPLHTLRQIPPFGSLQEIHDWTQRHLQQETEHFVGVLQRLAPNYVPDLEGVGWVGRAMRSSPAGGNTAAAAAATAATAPLDQCSISELEVR